MHFNSNVQRELTKALQAYMLISDRKDIVNYLLSQFQTVPEKIDRSLLPTVGYGSSFSKEENEDDWKSTFTQLQHGNIGMIYGIGKHGEYLQVTFDTKDQAFTLSSDNKLIMYNQNLDRVIHKFQSMFA